MIWMFLNRFLVVKNKYDVVEDLVHSWSSTQWLSVDARHLSGGSLRVVARDLSLWNVDNGGVGKRMRP